MPGVNCRICFRSVRLKSLISFCVVTTTVGGISRGGTSNFVATPASLTV
jgi:hypothetical protein